MGFVFFSVECQNNMLNVGRRDVKVSRPACSRDHIFGLGLGLIVVGLDLGLMKCRSRSHGSWSRGLLPRWMTIQII